MCAVNFERIPTYDAEDRKASYRFYRGHPLAKAILNNETNEVKRIENEIRSDSSISASEAKEIIKKAHQAAELLEVKPQ